MPVSILQDAIGGNNQSRSQSFVRFPFDFTEQSTLETTPGIDQFDWLISFQCLS